MEIQDYGCVRISSALVPNAPSEITKGSYFIFLSKDIIKKTLNTKKHTKKWPTSFPKIK
jgi:hypothetical protein